MRWRICFIELEGVVGVNKKVYVGVWSFLPHGHTLVPSQLVKMQEVVQQLAPHPGSLTLPPEFYLVASHRAPQGNAMPQ